MMIRSLSDKFVFQRMQWRLAHTGQGRRMHKHKREETKRHRRTIGHLTWPLFPQQSHVGELEETIFQMLFERHMLCVGKDTLSPSWNWAGFLHTASCPNPQNKSNPCATDDLPYCWTQHPRLLQASISDYLTVPYVTPHHFGTSSRSYPSYQCPP